MKKKNWHSRRANPHGRHGGPTRWAGPHAQHGGLARRADPHGTQAGTLGLAQLVLFGSCRLDLLQY